MKPPKTVKINHRVIVEPRRAGDFGSVRVSSSLIGNDEELAKRYEEVCEDLVHKIKRHVDDVGWVYATSDEVCAYCHCAVDPHTEDDIAHGYYAGMPSCCDRAELEWVAENSIEESSTTTTV